MNDLEKANEIAKHRESEFGEIRDINGCCYMSALDMAQWKDEQLESKLMQFIILAQQGYTCGATDEMILKHCKEIINENYERDTTKKD